MRKGYSIMELITILAAAGILSSAAIPAFQAVTQHAEELKVRSDKRVISAVQERYKTKHGYYAASLEVAGKDGGILEEDNP